MTKLSDTELAIKRAALRSYEIEIMRDGRDVSPALVRAYKETLQEIRQAEAAQ